MKAMLGLVLMVALFQVAFVDHAQAQLADCEIRSSGRDPSLAWMSFVMIEHDVRGSVRCRLPITRLQSLGATYAVSNLHLTLYWERSVKSFPFTLRVINASTGQEIPGQIPVMGPYSAMEYDYNLLLLSTSDDLIFEVTSKSGKSQYVGMGGIIEGAVVP